MEGKILWKSKRENCWSESSAGGSTNTNEQMCEGDLRWMKLKLAAYMNYGSESPQLGGDHSKLTTRFPFSSAMQNTKPFVEEFQFLGSHVNLLLYNAANRQDFTRMKDEERTVFYKSQLGSCKNLPITTKSLSTQNYYKAQFSNWCKQYQIRAYKWPLTLMQKIENHFAGRRNCSSFCSSFNPTECCHLIPPPTSLHFSHLLKLNH